jgi:hypothetical protein
MAKKPATIDVQTYYQQLRSEFLIGAKRTEVLPQLLARGENEEERVRAFFRSVLPSRFAVGSGFVLSSRPELGLSAQMDVIIYDNIHNAPIFRELKDHVYPVGMVYAVVEVKRLLERKNLEKILKDIQRIRRLAEERWYVDYTSMAPDPDRPEQRVTGRDEFQWREPKPRSYVVAFKQKGWASIEALLGDLRVALTEVDTHVHGMVVLDSDWYVTQKPFTPLATALRGDTENSLLTFVHNVQHSIASMQMFPASIDRYLRADPIKTTTQKVSRKVSATRKRHGLS